VLSRVLWQQSGALAHGQRSPPHRSRSSRAWTTGIRGWCRCKSHSSGRTPFRGPRSPRL